MFIMAQFHWNDELLFQHLSFTTKKSLFWCTLNCIYTVNHIWLLSSFYTEEFLLILKVKLDLSLTYPGIPDKNEKGKENWKDVFKCVTLCIRTAQNVWHFVEMLYFSCTRCWKSDGWRSKKQCIGAWTICHWYELKKYRINPDAAQTV